MSKGKKKKKEGRSQRRTLTEYFITHHHHHHHYSDTLPSLPVSPSPLTILVPSFFHAIPPLLLLFHLVSTPPRPAAPYHILSHYCIATKVSYKPHLLDTQQLKQNGWEHCFWGHLLERWVWWLLNGRAIFSTCILPNKLIRAVFGEFNQLCLQSGNARLIC